MELSACMMKYMSNGFQEQIFQKPLVQDLCVMIGTSLCPGTPI